MNAADNVTGRLLELAAKQTGLSRAELLAAIENPQWSIFATGRDAWLRLIPDELVELWKHFSLESRLSALLALRGLPQSHAAALED